MKPNDEKITLTLNTLLGKIHPGVKFDFSHYDENLFGNDRIICNVFMLASESYYEKFGDNDKHFRNIESEVRSILKMFGITSDDRLYYHWVGEDHFQD